MFFKQKSLDSILSTFDRVATELNGHVALKSREQLELLSLKAEIEDDLDTTAAEIDRADRVLAKVQDLVA